MKKSNKHTMDEIIDFILKNLKKNNDGRSLRFFTSSDLTIAFLGEKHEFKNISINDYINTPEFKEVKPKISRICNILHGKGEIGKHSNKTWKMIKEIGITHKKIKELLSNSRGIYRL